jgi:2-polyprenyl-6-methoxyphenol hydroxylase-like FAD-dependent oxidoreductase
MKAIVIGASIAGLIAARALSDHVEAVSVIDRDLPPDSAVSRKGVPQGRHVHGVLAGGLDAFKTFFPGIMDDLAADGARVVDTGHDVLWFNNGAWRLRYNCGVSACVQTRPLFELHVRRRVAKLPNISLFYGHSVTALELNHEKTRVTGVRVAQEGGEEKTLHADLVVDCSGRGSKLPGWLEANGLAKPSSTTITVNVGYSTQYFQVPNKDHLGWQAMLIVGQPPNITRLGAGFFVEGGELQLTLGGMFRDYPPDDDAGFLKFAQSLQHPAIFQAIQNAKATSPISTYRFSAHLWNHYDRLKDLPENILVLGDAMCSFNPIYGQGMTVAALEAQVLHKCLAQAKTSSDIKKLRDAYFRGVSSIVSAAWAMATGADISYPQAQAPKPFGHGPINRYLNSIISLSCYDKKALTVWNQVTNMQRPLPALFAPAIFGRVMKRALTGGPQLSTQQP